MATTALASSTPLADALRAIPFANLDTVTSSHDLRYKPIPSLYLEPEAPTKPRWAWADIDAHDYLFAFNASAPPPTCTALAPTPATDRPGGDLRSEPSTSEAVCSATCCNTTGCAAWVFDASAPGPFGGCAAGESCCYLKTFVKEPKPSANMSSGIVSRGADTQWSAPPAGLRSAPPLGGLAAGTFELRADGGFHAWTVENASPAGSTKIGELSEALVAVRASGGGVPTAARALRTAPPPGIAGVERLSFSGSQPFVRLVPHDAALPEGLNLTLYGRSPWRVGDLDGSTTPAAALTLSATNPTDAPLELSLLLTLPLSVQNDVARFGSPSAAAASSAVGGAMSAAECVEACAGDDGCASWTLDALASCTLHKDVPPAANAAGASSGVAGEWVGGRGDCVTLRRPGTHPQAGNLTLCGAAEGGSGASVTIGSAASVSELFDTFASDGKLGGLKPPTATHGYGAIAISLTIAPRASASASASLGWYLPHADFMGTEIGQFYATRYADAEEAAAAMLAPSAAAEVSALAAYLQAFHNSSVPEWLADILLNSLHHTRSSFYTKDGRWRQWEAYDCVNIDSVHNDGERHIPYIMLWPTSTLSKMRAWAAGQLDDGMIQEQLGCGCTGAIPPKLDTPCGRVMGDVSSMFIVYLLELWQWGAVDASVLSELWPAARRAAEWQLARANASGLPQHLVDTYDILGLNQYESSTFSSVFHLLAMRAAAALARTPPLSDTTFAAACDAAYTAGKAAINAKLWNASAGYFRSYVGGDALMADALYAQVLADTLGLGPLVDDDQVVRHLERTLRENGTPYGLLIQTGRYPPPAHEHNNQDNAIWMMANPNLATLQLWRGVAVDDALDHARLTLDRWRLVLKDQWAVSGVTGGVGYGAEGQPWITSHYGYYMSAWHILFALSGQKYDRGALSFAPRLAPPYVLPVLVPGTVATIEARVVAEGGAATTAYALRVAAGVPLALSALKVGDAAAPAAALPAALAPGEAVEWVG